MSRPFLLCLGQLPGDLIRVFRRERLFQVAAALTYSTLLTLVPLVTLVLVVAASLPGFAVLVGDLDKLFVQTLLPGKSGGAVASQVYQMASKARELAWPWLLGLVSTVFFMLRTLEGAFNQIWGVHEGRSWLRRLPLYLIGIVGVPVLMGGLSSLIGFLINLSLGWIGGLAPLQAFLLQGLNFCLLAGFFALLYHSMPAARVGTGAALFGGLAVSLALVAMQHAFRAYVLRVTFYSKVYGALSALPIFLLWLYLAWILILVVAVAVANLDGAFSKRRGRG